MNGISFARVKQATNSDAFTPRTAPPMHQTVSAPAPAPLTVKQRRARRKKQIIYGLIALVVLWIVGSIIWGKREKPIPVTTEAAIRKTIVQTVSATGKVQPETEVKISPEVAGEIIELPVEDGKTVKSRCAGRQGILGRCASRCRSTRKTEAIKPTTAPNIT